jgi:hypothetical protein
MGYKTWKANNNESGRGFTHFAKFDYAGINDNATSANQVTIAKIPAGGALTRAFVYETTALAGATDITLDVGVTASDPDEFIDEWDADAGTPAFNTGDAWDAIAAATGSGGTLVGHFGGGTIGAVSATATDVLAEWNGTVANLTAGEVFIALEIIDPLANDGPQDL